MTKNRHFSDRFFDHFFVKIAKIAFLPKSLKMPKIPRVSGGIARKPGRRDSVLKTPIIPSMIGVVMGSRTRRAMVGIWLPVASPKPSVF